MSYQIIFDPGAWREFGKLSKAQQKRAAESIEELGRDPRPAGTVRLTNVDAYRVRVGDLRIVYAVRDDILVVLVVRIADRRDVYRDLDAIRKRLRK